VYHVPLLLQQQNLHTIISEKMNLQINHINMDEWANMAQLVDELTVKVQIVIVGKYTGLQDSYLSVIKACKHAAISCKRDLDLLWVEAAHLEPVSQSQTDDNAEDIITLEQHNNAWDILRNADGVIVPGGFGNRGFLGKVLAAEYCRTNNKPYLGICLGFQAMVVEYCRNILHWSNANSEEFKITDNQKNVVIFMPEVDKDNMGGTMRLGSRDTVFTSQKMSTIQLLYNKKEKISERHRHRYEVNPDFVDDITKAGLEFVGKDETGTRMEICTLEDHAYYVGCQYHPEFQSRPLDPSPPFLGLMLAATGMLHDYVQQHS